MEVYFSLFSVNCTYTWGETECSVTCGGGTKTRYPIITSPAEHGGHCPSNETVTCNTNRCPSELLNTNFHNYTLSLYSVLPKAFVS